MDDWGNRRLNMVERKNHNQSVNTPEKIAATYLRLNGFLLLPHFTTFFARPENNHVDLIGYRPAKSKELVHRKKLERDVAFSKNLTETLGKNSVKSKVGIIVQVRGNAQQVEITDEQVEYVKSFLGGIDPVRILFHCQKPPILIEGNQIRIDLKYSYHWIQNRVKEMERVSKIHKTGSWTLSEEFLGDLLSLRRIVCRTIYY